MSRKALGKGLRSLIPEAPARVPLARSPAGQPGSEPREGLLQIDVDRIRPNRQQPRQRFDDETLDSLAKSLKTEGMLQPVVVRPIEDGRFELVAGERRWRAAQRAGLLRVPALVKEVPEERLLEFALIENLQREELNPIEEAHAYRTLVEKLGLTQQAVAERVGKDRATVANTMRLLTLPEAIQGQVRDGKLSMGQARPLVSLTDRAEQLRLAERAVREGLSVRQVESLAAALERKGAHTGKRRLAAIDPNVAAAEANLARALGTKVRIIPGRRGGRLELRYYSDEELERLYQILVGASRRKA